MKKLSLLLILAFFSSLFFMNKLLAESKYMFKETQNLVKMVDTAVRLVEKYGEEVFPEFRKKGSKWFKGNQYIFIDDMAGTSIVNPAFPGLEGKNMIALQDVWGKYLVKDYIREVYKYGKNKHNGWFHYLWPKPKTGEISWKTTYIARATAPNGTSYVIGAGDYNMRMEKEFLHDAVEDAVKVIKTHGLKNAINILESKDEEFFFNDTHVFVVTDKAEELANKVFPHLSQKQQANFWKIQDIERKYVFKEFYRTVKRKKSGWVVATWAPKTNHENLPNYEYTYVKGLKIQDKFLIVGSSANFENPGYEV
ncbi:MAG: hypothetical protein GY817_03075 [bacterium]|nr:hypothetical protein [bacterium]